MNVSISSTMTLQCVGVTTRFLLSVLFWTDPVFVGSAYIEESQPIGNPVGDDDKIYFFFSEAGKEFDFFDNTIVSRIARVCKVRHLRSPHKNSRAKTWGPGRLELPVNNPQPNNYLKNKAGGGAPSPPGLNTFLDHASCLCGHHGNVSALCLRVELNKHVLDRFGFSRPDTSSPPGCGPSLISLRSVISPLSSQLPDNVSRTHPSLQLSELWRPC